MEIIYHRPAAFLLPWTGGKEMGGGGRVDLKCENKYSRDSKKIRKESGMKTRLGRVDSCAGVFIPPFPPRGERANAAWSDGEYIYIYIIKIRRDDVRG